MTQNRETPETGHLTAAEYANRGMMDSATAMGMRLAMQEAVMYFKEQEKSGHLLTVTSAENIINRTVDNNKYLKAAGTQQLVKNYYHQVIERNGETKLRDFLKGASGDINIVNELDNGSAISGIHLAWDANKTLKSATDHLGVKTLTEDFLHVIKTDPKVTAGVIIDPQPFSEKSAQKLSEMDKEFRDIDNMTPPTVNQWIAHTDPAKEATISGVLNSTGKMAAGQNHYTLISHLRGAELAPGAAPGVHNFAATQEDLQALTSEEALKVGARIDRAMALMRLDTPGYSADSVGLIIKSKGASDGDMTKITASLEQVNLPKLNLITPEKDPGLPSHGPSVEALLSEMRSR